MPSRRARTDRRGQTPRRVRSTTWSGTTSAMRWCSPSSRTLTGRRTSSTRSFGGSGTSPWTPHSRRSCGICDTRCARPGALRAARSGSGEKAGGENAQVSRRWRDGFSRAAFLTGRCPRWRPGSGSRTILAIPGPGYRTSTIRSRASSSIRRRLCVVGWVPSRRLP